MATYWVDPDATDDTGDGSKSNPWKTINHTVSAGDTIQIKKSPLSTMSWTVSGTYGQRDLTPSSDPTGDISQYDMLKIDGEYYQVRAVTSSLISTYKPFLSTTGNGYTVEKVGVFDIGSTYWQVYSSGTSGNKINIKGGYDWTTEVQDGETFISSSTIYALRASSKDYFHIEKIHPVNASSYCLYITSSTNWDINGMICCRPKPYINVGTDDINSQIQDMEVQVASTFNLGFDSDLVNQDIDIWLYGGIMPTLGYPDKEMWFKNVRINGSTSNQGAVNVRGKRIFFSNLQLGQVLSNTANHISFQDETEAYCVNSIFDLDSNGSYEGKIFSIRHNQTSNKNATIINAYGGTEFNGHLESDDSIYRTASPSIKFTPNSSNQEIFQEFEVPLSVGTKTISVYLRKNSSYNGAKLPFMRIRYFIGTTNAEWSVEEVEMSDIDDTWVQVSKTLTIEEEQAALVRIGGMGTAGNFWCDDLEVS